MGCAPGEENTENEESCTIDEQSEDEEISLFDNNNEEEEEEDEDPADMGEADEFDLEAVLRELEEDDEVEKLLFENPCPAKKNIQ